MSQEIFSAKLRELEDRILLLKTRIRLCEREEEKELSQEIPVLLRECQESEQTLREKLRFSRARTVQIVSDSYEEISAILHKTREILKAGESSRTDPDETAEEKILLAEYALDFAVQAADRALLLCMEAIQSQKAEQKKQQRA